MTEVEKIREEVVKLKSQLLRGACSSQIVMETRCKEEAYNEVIAILDSLQEEPVSEELDDAAKKYGTKKHPMTTIGANESAYDFKAGAKWQKEQDQETIELAEDHAMLAGMEKMKDEMMAKAIKWVEYNNENGGCKFDGWVENIKQAMKDE